MTTDIFARDPHTIIQDLEHFSFQPTGRSIQLNSIENRCFEIELEKDRPQPFPLDQVVVKYYRPERHSSEHIRGEHKFWLKAQELGITHGGPLVINGESLFEIAGTNRRFTIMPKIRGRLLEEVSDYKRLGELVGRLHTLSADDLKGRPRQDPKRVMAELEFLRSEVSEAEIFAEAALRAIENIAEEFPKDQVSGHGDLHRGNVIEDPRTGIWNLVDFDDSGPHPAAQDLWLLLPGPQDLSLHEQALNDMLDGYQIFRDPPPISLRLVEILRLLRICQHTAWIARRRSDPSFERLFPDLWENSFWNKRVLDLGEQIRWLDSVS